MEIAFDLLLARVRKGDSEAATALLQQYEPQIRRMVRVRLTDASLRRQFDTLDICQSVWGDFFVRMGTGQFEIDTPAALVKLLATMTRHKLINRSQRQRAAKRDVRRLEKQSADEMDVAGSEATPSRIVSGRELLAIVRQRLDDDDRYLADERAKGRSWIELAEELHTEPDALRMRLARATRRISHDVDFGSIAG